VTVSSREETAALEALARELDAGRYATIMVGGHEAPTLRVVNRQAPQLTEEIYVGPSHFCYSSSEPIALVTNAPAAAEQIARVLNGGPAKRSAR
jgi:hypothetical protein